MATQIALMELTKASNKSVAVVGEIIQFTIIASNVGNVTIGNVADDPVYVYDLLPSELAFVRGSVKVDGASEPTFDISSGINLGTINAGKSKSITFKAEVVSNDNDIIENMATGSYSYVMPGSYPRKINVDSNTIEIMIYNADLSILKSANKKNVVLKDTVSYTVELTNTGNLNLSNVIFIDDLPEGTELIDGSFKVNGIVINKVDIEKGVNVGNIGINQSTTIEYTVRVLRSTCSLKLENKARATYTYTLPDGTTGKQATKETESSSSLVFLSINNFKQTSIEEYLRIPPQKPDIEEINMINGNIDVVNCHLIETGRSKSIEGQIITGYKLIVHGVLRIVVEYTACEPCQSVHASHYDIPFTTFIVLPENYKSGNKLDINAIVEDIYYKDIDCRTLFTNATILINVKTC